MRLRERRREEQEQTQHKYILNHVPQKALGLVNDLNRARNSKRIYKRRRTITREGIAKDIRTVRLIKNVWTVCVHSMKTELLQRKPNPINQNKDPPRKTKLLQRKPSSSNIVDKRLASRPCIMSTQLKSTSPTSCVTSITYQIILIAFH